MVSVATSASPNAMKTFIGVDPGKSGAIAVVALDGSPMFVEPFDHGRYIDAMREFGANAFAVVEHVGAMPKQGSVSMFHFGENFGWIQGALEAMGVPFELVRPVKWKKVFSCTSDKNTSIEVAQRMFPKVDLRRTPQCKKPHDGKAEALLMAEYARRMYVDRVNAACDECRTGLEAR